MFKKNITTVITILVVILIAAGAYLYISSNAAKKKSSETAQSQVQGSKVITLKATSYPKLLPPGLPVPKSSTDVITNTYYFDSANMLHAEYEYSEANPSKGTAQQNFMSYIKVTGWQNITSTGSIITATKNNYKLTTSFTNKDAKNSIIDIKYTDVQ